MSARTEPDTSDQDTEATTRPTEAGLAEPGGLGGVYGIGSSDGTIGQEAEE